ncbi:MAG TPA: bifunctional DNA primase/polymerase [Nitrososphaerales archaeon]|nr:bifunctional DNA primase/polymerase [Nitrososphaerales archaeon]
MTEQLQTFRPPFTIQGYIRLYRKLGFNVFPLKPRTKDEFLFPSWGEFQTRAITEEEIRKFWPANTQNNVAIVTGVISNLWVLDFDSIQAYEKAFSEEERTKLESSTLVVRTGKGIHAYFRAPAGQEGRNQAYETQFGHVDVRAEGGYVVAAPSVHPSGRLYTIVSSACTVQGADLELVGFVLKRLGYEKKEYKALASDYAEAFKLACENDEELRDLYSGAWQKWVKKTRSEAEFRLVRKLVRIGFSDETITEIMDSCSIGKWQEKEESYRKLTLEKARRSVIDSRLAHDMKKKKVASYTVQPDGSVKVN